jgi:hypothetical protein
VAVSASQTRLDLELAAPDRERIARVALQVGYRTALGVLGDREAAEDAAPPHPAEDGLLALLDWLPPRQRTALTLRPASGPDQAPQRQSHGVTVADDRDVGRALRGA